jgi:hypothetical protein
MASQSHSVKASSSDMEMGIPGASSLTIFDDWVGELVLLLHGCRHLMLIRKQTKVVQGVIAQLPPMMSSPRIWNSMFAPYSLLSPISSSYTYLA